MPYVPEFPDEIRRRLLSRLVGTSRLVDLAEGSEFGSLLGAVSDEMASYQQKLGEMHAAHFFDCGGELLDDRVAQLPAGFTPRRGAAPAAGGDCIVYRDDASLEEVYPPGSMTFGREDAPDLGYTNAYAVTFAAGEDTTTGVTVICTSPGFYTNVAVGGLNTIVASAGTLYRVNNTLPVSGGRDVERDASLQARARLWMGALTRTTAAAIEAIAIEFHASIRTARVWESLDTRGYAEVLIDDGFGFIGSTRDAVEQSGVVPTIDSYHTRYQFTFESPAATPPTLTVNGTDYPAPHPDYLTIEERGVMLMRPEPSTLAIAPGDDWSVGGHKVYIGVPAALQAYLETQCRAAGSRLRVVLPTPHVLTMSANVTVYSGYDIDEVFDQVKQGIIAYTADIQPGRPLLIFRLCGALINIPGVRNVKFDQTDFYPGTPQTKFIVYYGGITLR